LNPTNINEVRRNSLTSLNPIILLLTATIIHRLKQKKTKTSYCDTYAIQRFSNEGRKTNTKVFTPTNHNRNKKMNQSGIEANISIKLASRAGKRMRTRHDWFLILLLIGLESGARVLVQSESEVKQNQSKHNITFHTHLEKLSYYSYGNTASCSLHQ